MVCGWLRTLIDRIRLPCRLSGVNSANVRKRVASVRLTQRSRPPLNRCVPTPSLPCRRRHSPPVLLAPAAATAVPPANGRCRPKSGTRSSSNAWRQAVERPAMTYCMRSTSSAAPSWRWILIPVVGARRRVRRRVRCRARRQGTPAIQARVTRMFRTGGRLSSFMRCGASRSYVTSCCAAAAREM